MTYPKDKLFGDLRNTEIDKNCCLVIMPFSDEFESVYNCIVRAVENKPVSMICKRADKMDSTKTVIDDILLLIQQAHIVIADLTSLNLNVLYELGICHTLKDNVIMISQNVKDIPFDFKQLRMLPYKNDISGGFELVDDLTNRILSIKDKPISNVTKSTSDIKPIEELRGPSECLFTLVEKLESSMEEHGKDFAVVRALPIEFTASIFGPKINEKKTDFLRRYKKCINYVVSEGDQGVENWDYTIYGQVEDSSLNNATLKFINDVYFNAQSMPETTEIGFDPTWNHVGFFVIGQSRFKRPEFKPDVTFLFFGDPDSLIPDSGCIIHDTKFSKLVVDVWYPDLQQKCINAKAYWNLFDESKSGESIESFKLKFEKVYKEK